MEEISIKGSKLHLLPIIHGLVGEEKKVREAFERIKPDCIAIGIPPEDIEIMAKMEKEESKEELEISLQYQYYLMHLSKYGKVSLPPMDIKTAYEIAEENNIPIKAIDIDDNEYAELLVDNVSIFALIRHSMKLKKLRRKKFKAGNAKEFVKEWQKEMQSIKSFRRLEEIRDKKMVENIVKLCKEFKKILAIIPFEKYESLILKLERYKK